MTPVPEPRINPWIVASSVMLATFMEVLDTTVVNVSLPHIAGSLSASVDEATWTLTSYLVANAIILPMTGWLAQTFGRKRLLMAAVVGFTGGSVLCGLSTSLSMLIFFRVIQGAAGGVLQPISQAVMLEAFPPEDRGKAMGFWGVGIVVAPMLGPVLGGWLTDSYSWRWIFYINVPVGLAALLMTRLFIFDPPYLRRASVRVDTWGIAALALGIGALQVVLDKGQENDWFGSQLIVALSIVCVTMLTAFIIRELMADHPVVNLRVFRDRTYAAGTGLMTMLGFVLYGSMVALPIFLQSLLGYTSERTGITMLPRGLGSFVAMPVVGILVGRLDPRKMLAVGAVGAGLSIMALSHLNLDAGYWNLFLPQLSQGIFTAMLFVPLTTVTMDPIRPEEMGNATSLFNLMRNIGGSIGIASGTTMIARTSQTFINDLVKNVNPYRSTDQALLMQLRHYFISRGSDAVTALHQAYAALNGIVGQQAALLSYINEFKFFGIVSIAMVPLVFLMRRPRGGRGPVAMH
jgi:MFS transporter, DHA2 family, multidrug resistance protein